MYSKFEVSVGNFFYGQEINEYLSTGRDFFNECSSNVKSVLEKYILSTDALDGDMMKEEWFKTQKYDVFLSHSHKDIDKVKAFSGWLHDKFGLKCFIDSCVWRYCDDLLREIDDKYCRNKPGRTYNYKRRNYSTAHVHMMLSIALTEVMNLSECVMFFNTPNSVSLVDDLNCIKNGNNKHGKIKVSISPWIYHELAMSSYLKRTTPDRFEKNYRTFAEGSEIRAKKELKIQYKISKYLEGMNKLSDEGLKMWAEQYEKVKPVQSIDVLNEQYEKEKLVHPLDVLYEQYKKV